MFLAEDLVLGRRVALKVPRPEVLVTPEVSRRFLREAEAASRLDHPHIVPVYEVGEEGPICYIASAYCEGLTLAQWLRLQTASVPIRLACRLVGILSVAVGYAHERGILHRDLKPGNILLQRLDGLSQSEGGECDDLGFIPRICDFGLAKLLDQVSQETRSGVPIGSPAYMAPEQAGGRLREHGPATDVYALGVILYELLTGRPPHRGETDLETLRLVSDQYPPSPRALRPGLPRDLETIAMKCLEKRPDRRYSNAWELAADLQRFVDGRPVQARPVRAWEHAGKWAKRRPMHATLAVVLGAFVLAVVGGFGWAQVREKQHNDELRVADDRSRLSETAARDQRAVADQHRLLAYRYRAANQLKVAGSLVERKEYEPAMSILETLSPPQGLPDARGFVWHYLDGRCRPAAWVRVLATRPNIVKAVASRADGRMIALADDRNNTFIVDRDTGTMKEFPAEHKLKYCEQLVFSPDGRTLASLSRGRAEIERGKTEVKLWDVASGALLAGTPDDFGYCYKVMFSPDSGRLVTLEALFSNRNTPVRSWRLPGEPKRVTLDESFRGDQLRACFSRPLRTPDRGSQSFRISDVVAVTAGDDSTTAVLLEGGEINLYNTNIATRTAICRIVGAEVVFVPRTDDPAVPRTAAEVDEIGRLACALTGCARARPISQAVPVVWARFSRDGRTAAVMINKPGRSWARLRLIDVATNQVIVEHDWGGPGGCTIDFVPGENAAVVGGVDEKVRLWDLNNWRAPGTLETHHKEVWGLAFSPDGRTLASSGDDHTIKLWDVALGLEKTTLKAHGSLVTAVVFSPDGKLLASAGWDKTIRLWKASSGALLATLEGHTAHVFTVAFSPDGKTLASAGDDRAIRFWEVATRRERSAPLSHTKRVSSLAFAPDGKTLYSGSLDWTIKLWDLERGRLRTSWPAEDEVGSLAVSPDGQTLAVSQFRETVRLWDVAQQKARQPLLGGHAGDVLGGVAFSPDGLTLAAAGQDHSVRLWDPATGLELLTLKGHTAAVHGIAFSPDGTILATGSHDGVIKLWRASPGLTGHEAYVRARP